jgi:hypothetical protein
MALYHNWKKPYESQEGRAASVTSQRRMQVAVISLFLVFTMAVLPVIDINIDSITYRKACDDNGTTVVTRDVNGSETTAYTPSIGDDTTATRIPLYWWLVLTFSSGINNAATSNLKCFTEIKELDQQLRHLTIRDQALRQEYIRFANECYFPAKTKYLNGLKGDYGEDFANYIHSQYDAVNSIVGDLADPLYIGSEFYLRTPGFYDWSSYTPRDCNETTSGCSLRASSPVPNWPYRSTRDTNHSQTDIDNGVAGAPFCDEWWYSPAMANGQPLALKTKLLNSIERASLDILDWDNSHGLIWNFRRIIDSTVSITYSDEQVEKLIISRYTAGEPPPMVDENWRNVSAQSIIPSVNAAGYAGVAAAAISTTTAAAAITEALPAVLAVGGYVALDIASTFKDFYLTMFLLKSAAPFAQAIILMMMYGLLIFYLVISEYDIEAILLMTFLILAVRFLTPLWDVADYLDAKLFTAMYQHPLYELGSTLTQGINRVILDMVQTVTYIVVPGIFLLVMGMAGLKLGRAASGMDSISSPLNKVSTSNLRSLGKSKK